MDFIVAPFDFNATSVNVAAKSTKAKALFADKFGVGAVSVEIPKSNLPTVIDQLEADGFKVDVI